MKQRDAGVDLKRVIARRKAEDGTWEKKHRDDDTESGVARETPSHIPEERYPEIPESDEPGCMSWVVAFLAAMLGWALFGVLVFLVILACRG